MEGGLGPLRPVEEKRMIRASANGPVAQPRVAVVDIPKQRPLDFVRMPEEDSGEFFFDAVEGC